MLDLIGRVYAQGGGATTSDIPSFSFWHLAPGQGVGVLVVNILNWVIGLIGVLAVFYFIYGGILYLTAGADADKATKGRTVIVNAIIGIIIIVAAFVILRLVANLISSA